MCDLVRADGSTCNLSGDFSSEVDTTERAAVKEGVSFSSLVPKEEQADSTQLPAKYSDAREVGVFSPAAEMACITGVLDDRLFAAIRVDETGSRVVEFCQRYDGGNFSPKIAVSQADLRFAAMNKFVPEGIPVPRMKARLGRFLEQVTIDYYGRVSGSNVYQPVEILNALVAALDQLPEFYMSGGRWTRETLYTAIMDMVNGKSTAPIQPFGNHRAYMAFSEIQIDAMTEHLGMGSARELLKLLEEYHFLYLTESSQGYQR